jgi:8-oxo-dGTP pyrophosphatase MutT (NUDIX family)
LKSVRTGTAASSPADVAAAVCYRLRRGRPQFLLVRTSGGRKWTFPKGHVKRRRGERAWEAAAREAREEAGVTGTIGRRSLAYYEYPSRTDRPGVYTDAPVAAFLMEVTAQDASFEPGRAPAWLSPDAALRRLAAGGRELRYVREQARVLRAALGKIGARTKPR